MFASLLSSQHCLGSSLFKLQSINSLLAYPTKHSCKPSRTDILLYLQLIQSKQVYHLSMVTTITLTVMQQFSKYGPIRGLWDSFKLSLPWSQSYFTIILRYYLLFWLSISVEFSRDYIMCDIPTNWILKQIWKPSCLLLNQTLKRSVKI